MALRNGPIATSPRAAATGHSPAAMVAARRRRSPTPPRRDLFNLDYAQVGCPERWSRSVDVLQR